MDLNKVPAKLKADALRVGVLFGSPTVLDEVERSLQAQDKHAALLGDGGYTAADRLYVVQARDALVEGIVRDMQGIAEGAALPALGEGDACVYCKARGLCRKDFWAAA